jgi:hypothetical protein
MSKTSNTQTGEAVPTAKDGERIPGLFSKEDLKRAEWKFWEISERGTIRPLYTMLYQFLSKKGYRLELENEQLRLFKLKKPFIYDSYVPDLCGEIQDHFKTKFQPEQIVDEVKIGVREPQVYEFYPKDIYEGILKHGFSKIFSELNLTNLPQEPKLKVLHDTRDAAYFFFKNKAVRVTKDGPELLDYSDIKQYVPHRLVLDREIELLDLDAEGQDAIAPKGSCFENFLMVISSEYNTSKGFIANEWEDNAGNGYIVNKDKLRYLKQLIGYLLHNYRQRGLTDYYPYFLDDEGGGSGKGLIFEAISQLFPDEIKGNVVCEVDATTVKKNEEKSPANLTKETRIKLYNDAHKSFDLKALRNEITDRQYIEHKFKDKQILPLNSGWKVAVTSNSMPYSSDDADRRRVRLFDLFGFFNKNYRIAKHYGHAFFSEDWKKEDWTYFFNVMFDCVAEWFQAEYVLNYNDPALQLRKLEKYSQEFRDWINAKLYFYKVEGPEDKPTLVPVSHLEFETSKLWEDFKLCEAHRRTDNSNSFGRLLTAYLNDAGYQWDRNTNRTKIFVFAKK